MSDCAVITTRSRELGLCLLDHGDPDTVGALLEYCALQDFCAPEIDGAGWATLCAVAHNYLFEEGGSSMLALRRYDPSWEWEPKGYGVYVTEGWSIVDAVGECRGLLATGRHEADQDGLGLVEMIDAAQPKAHQLGSEFVGTRRVPTSSLEVGDLVYVRPHPGWEPVVRSVLGFGELWVDGRLMKDVPYVDLFGVGDPARSACNYLVGEKVRLATRARQHGPEIGL